jgi:hypothetical protein
VGARPEVGKTSFVTSELCYILRKHPKETVLWINNEESADRLLVRHMSSVLRARGVEIRARKDAAYAAFLKRTGWTPETVRVFDAHYATLAEIEAQINALNPSIIVLHRIDKLPAAIENDANDVQRLEAVAFWARRLAAPPTGPGRAVIGVMQAGESAHGVLFPDDSQLYRTKTGLQSEMDAIIMIGAENISDKKRGINIPRNKLLGGPRSNEAKRHGRFECALDHITGRFTSVAYADKE